MNMQYAQAVMAHEKALLDRLHAVPRRTTRFGTRAERNPHSVRTSNEGTSK
jgi:hypothetical protein